MDGKSPVDIFYGLFERQAETGRSAETLGVCKGSKPRTVPDPHTGRPLQVASVEVSDRSVCPACAQLGAGGYVSFVSDLRIAFACPNCRKLVWVSGA